MKVRIYRTPSTWWMFRKDCPILSRIPILRMWAVERNPIPKRRRNWRVVRKTLTEPAAYRVGDTLIVHPTIFEKLKELPC